MRLSQIDTLERRVLTETHSLPSYGRSVNSGCMQAGRLWEGQELFTDQIPMGSLPIGKQIIMRGVPLLTIYDDGTAILYPYNLWLMRYSNTRREFRAKVDQYYDTVGHIDDSRLRLARKSVSGMRRLSRTDTFLNYITDKKEALV